MTSTPMKKSCSDMTTASSSGDDDKKEEVDLMWRTDPDGFRYFDPTAALMKRIEKLEEQMKRELEIVRAKKVK